MGLIYNLAITKQTAIIVEEQKELLSIYCD